MKPPSRRTDDLELLRALLAVGIADDREHGLTEDEHASFSSMLSSLKSPRPGHTRGFAQLTDKQREWAEGRAVQLAVSWARDNRHVPRGAEVETPEVLRVLPKAPPGRRRSA